MITLKWLKTVAENLRLGLYTTPKRVYFRKGGEVCIKDLDNKISISMYSYIIQTPQSYKNKKQKEEIYTPSIVLKTIITELDIEGATHFIDYLIEGEEYKFWEDFTHWCQQQYKDRELNMDLKAIELFTL